MFLGLIKDDKFIPTIYKETVFDIDYIKLYDDGIRLILTDLDNTLVDDDENRRYAIKQILLDRNETEINNKIENFIDIDNQYWRDRAQGKIKDPYKFKNNEDKTRWVRAQRFIKFFKDISFEEAVEINNKYINYLSKNIVPIKNSQEILRYLYEKQYEIYIVTNGPIIVINADFCSIYLHLCYSKS